MALPDENAEVLRAIARGTSRTPVDVLGTSLEFLSRQGTPATVHAS